MKKLFSTLFVIYLGLSFKTIAQDENSSAPELLVSGSIDAYYRANINASNSKLVSPGTYAAPGSSFANQPGFSLGMANVILEMQGEKTGFVADLVFGPRGTDAVFGSTTASSSIVNQLYVYWRVSESTTLTLGNFNTFLGYEVISPTANFNYSTSYAFSYGPFSHSGLKADFTLSDDASLMLAIMNSTDATDFNPSGDYVLGAQVGISGQYFNFIYDGANDFYQVDYTGGFDLSETVFFGINATSAKDNFLAAALYLQNSFSDDFSMGLRGEYFKDEGIGLFTEGENVIDLTLSANYSVGSLTIIPEIRVDILSEEGFVTDSEGLNFITGNPINPEMGKNLSSFVLAAVYRF